MVGCSWVFCLGDDISYYPSYFGDYFIHREVRILINQPVEWKVGGGNLNVVYFHPEKWGNDPI